MVKIMKKLVAILVALLYIAVSSGFTVNMHYCMGKLAGVKLQAHADKHCNKCGKSGKCCKDEIRFCKADFSHEAAAKVQANTAPAVKVLTLPVIIYTAPPATIIRQFTAYHLHGPPGQGAIPLFKQLCVYRI